MKMPYKGENIVRKGEIACYNFSFSHNVFHSFTSFVRQNALLCGNGLIAFNLEKARIL